MNHDETFGDIPLIVETVGKVRGFKWVLCSFRSAVAKTISVKSEYAEINQGTLLFEMCASFRSTRQSYIFMIEETDGKEL